ncbi:MAG: signal peptidase I [Clostridia bacterium]|nr:signal peptidase I [Clostridia bacterium]
MDKDITGVFSKSELRAMQKFCNKRNEKVVGGQLWRVIDFTLYLLAVIVFALAIRSVVVEPVRVKGSSMLDTLHEGDYMVVEKLSYAFSSPKRGDILIIWYPNNDEYTCVKRVIGVSGDHVVMEPGRDGYVSVNGEILSEPYVSSLNTHRCDEIVPEGCVFVLGDNRAVSKDSSSSVVGSIPVANIVGRVRCVVWPSESAQIFD